MPLDIRRWRWFWRRDALRRFVEAAGSGAGDASGDAVTGDATSDGTGDGTGDGTASGTGDDAALPSKRTSWAGSACGESSPAPRSRSPNDALIDVLLSLSSLGGVTAAAGRVGAASGVDAAAPTIVSKLDG